jgi:ABC-type nitrate/sulfonate/bicarbonate transport system substrate-binding protein
MIRFAIALTLLATATVASAAETVLRVGDQKGNTQAVMEAAGVLKDVPYKIERKEFAAAAPLLEALGAGAIDTGLVGAFSLREPVPTSLENALISARTSAEHRQLNISDGRRRPLSALACGREACELGPS